MFYLEHERAIAEKGAEFLSTRKFRLGQPDDLSVLELVMSARFMKKINDTAQI